MAIIASIDITDRRIFLDDGVVALNDALAFWREYRDRRVADTDSVRQSAPVMEIIGGQSKGGGKLVGRVIDLKGYKIVPQDTTHDLDVTIEIIDSNLGISGRDVFDRSPLTPGVNVNIDINIAPVEVQLLETGVSGLTAAESALLNTLTPIYALCSAIKGFLFGRQKIDDTTKEMIAYDEDNTTELVRFDLKDQDGNASSTAVFDRIRQ